MKEGKKEMSEDKRSAMMELYSVSLRDIKEGEIVKGKIIEVTRQEVVIDVGFKSEGFISLEEFHRPEDLQVGQEIDVLIESIEDDEGGLILSHEKAEKYKGWQKITTEIKEGDYVDGRVVKQVKGGFIVDVYGVDAFLPMSLSSFKGMSPAEIMANKFKFQIAKMNTQRRNIILSRRDLVQKEKENAKAKLWDQIAKGQRMKGAVKGITDFGAFIDLGGVDGLLHITDMSWSRINHPSEIVALGDKIEVLILDFDRENAKVSLGLKQILPNPWDDVEKRYPLGTKVKGKVVNIMPYGVFVEIDRGIEGLLHSSEISWKKKAVNPQEMFSVGDILEIQIISIDKDAKRISLSLRQLEANPWQEAVAKYPVGVRVQGKVKGFTDYGAFVELQDNLEGMIHVSDMSWTKKVNHPQEILKKGQDIEVMVLAVDPESRKITLGLKQTMPNPWSEIAQKYPVGTEVDSQVVANSNFGVFVKLEEDLEALVYSSEIEKSAAVALKPGDKLRVKVIKVDTDQMKIGLSTRF